MKKILVDVWQTPNGFEASIPYSGMGVAARTKKTLSGKMVKRLNASFKEYNGDIGNILDVLNKDHPLRIAKKNGNRLVVSSKDLDIRYTK